MHPDTPPADTADAAAPGRRPGRPGRQLHLGGQLAGVLAESPDRSAAANWISSIVVGPRPPGVRRLRRRRRRARVGAHAGRRRCCSPGAPRVIDQGLLWTQWRSSCARRRDELAAAHASYRLERYRIEAALERARYRPVVAAPRREPVPEASPPPEPVVTAPPEPADGESEDRDPDDGGPVDQAPLRAQLRELLEELETLPAGPLPEGELLAEAWDAHDALVRLRDAVEPVPSADVDAHRAPRGHRACDRRRDLRKRARRSAGADRSSAIGRWSRPRPSCSRRSAGTVPTRSPTTSTQWPPSSCPRRRRASSRTPRFSSRSTRGPAAANAAKRRRAQAELAEARAELDAVLQIPDMPTRAELEEREAHMRIRAAELLGREPGADPRASLRALRVPTEERVELLDEITEVLRAADVVVTGDPARFARASSSRRPAGRCRPRAADDGLLNGCASRRRPRRSAPAPAPVASVRRSTSRRWNSNGSRMTVRSNSSTPISRRSTRCTTRRSPTLGAADLTCRSHVMLDLYRAGQLLGGPFAARARRCARRSQRPGPARPR